MFNIWFLVNGWCNENNISQKHNFCWIYFWCIFCMFCDILKTKRSSMENFNRIIHCAAAMVAKNDYSRFSHRTAWGKKEKSWDFSPDDFWWKKRHLHRVYIRIGRHFQFSWIASLSEDLGRIYKRCWIYDIASYVCSTYLEYQANYRFERGVKMASRVKKKLVLDIVTCWCHRDKLIAIWFEFGSMPIGLTEEMRCETCYKESEY